MTTYILGENRTPEKLILAEKAIGAEKAFLPYRVRITQTYYYHTEKSCMDFFQKQNTPATDSKVR